MRDFWVIDIEASGLSPISYPIEIGLLNDRQEYQALIVPEDSWYHWSPKSEDLHGISREELYEKGKAAVVVAKELNELLGTQAVYSDHEDWDSFWLGRLFESVGIRQELSVVDINSLLEIGRTGSFDELSQYKKKYSHRALDDARVNRHAVIEALTSSSSELSSI